MRRACRCADGRFRKMKLAISNIISSTARSEHELGGARLTLKVSPRARRMRLHVDPRTRAVILTMPKRMSQRRALAWAAGHGGWVEAALAAIPEPIPFAPGAIVPLYGLPHRLDWDPGRPRRVERGEERLGAGGARGGADPGGARRLEGPAPGL